MLMDGEISAFIRVWASVFASMVYCFAVARIATKRWVRLIMFLPVIYLFLVLPFNLTSFHLGCPTVFFISWLANAKLLLLAFGNGPLSHQSLTIVQFVFLACFPIKLQENRTLKHRQVTGNPKEEHLAGTHINMQPRPRSTYSHMANRAIILTTLVWLGHWREHLNPKVFLFCVSMYIYVGLDLILSVMAYIAGFLVGKEIDAPFDNPFMSTSLRDFWGRRWNRVASDNLKSVVYWPVYNYSSRKMGAKWARVEAIIATFLVSAFLHELLMYYLGRTMPTWRTAAFFLFHGLCLVVEDAVKEKFTGGRKWPFSPMSKRITGPLIFGFFMLTAKGLLVQDALDHNLDARVVEEWNSFAVFVCKKLPL